MTRTEAFVDISYNSLNKKNESLCGDKVQIYKSEERIIAVLADGLGSGVKANILATLTSQIAVTMIKRNAGISEVVDTIMHTLPVCSVRKIAYSTFSIVEIDKDLNCQIYEYDNPSFFFMRKGKVLETEKKLIKVHEKDVYTSRFKLEENDVVYILSDGVIHAGAGKYLPFGWKWEYVALFLERQNTKTAFSLCNKLLNACSDLYDNEPDDDTTVVTIKIRPQQLLNVFTGPPADKELDSAFIDYFKRLQGKKMISGGTTAQIYARETGSELKANLDYIDSKVPVTASINGVDLVTEGVVTMSKCTELIKKYKTDYKSVDLDKKDGATRMLKLFLEESTSIKIWFGKAVNQAHQNHYFPVDLSFKINVVIELVEALKSLGKEVELEYISEHKYEKI